MTVYELIQELTRYPSDTPVLVSLYGENYQFDENGEERKIKFNQNDGYEINDVRSHGYYTTTEVVIVGEA